MFKQVFFPGLAAAMLGCLAPLMSPVTPQQHASQQIDENLSALTRVLVSMESKSNGSQDLLTAQISQLATAIEQTNSTTQAQIDSLKDSIAKVHLVATTTTDGKFAELVTKFEEQGAMLDDAIGELQSFKEKPEKQFGTLDVNSMPSGSEDEDGRPQSFSALVDIVLRLQKSIDGLEKRSTSSSTPTYVPTSTVSGNSCGSVATAMPAAYSSYSSPVYESQVYYPSSSYQSTSYPSVSYSSSPVRTSSGRQGFFSRLFGGNGTCRIVNGVQVCN